MTSNGGDSGNGGKLYEGYHVLCYLDLLGQKEKLREWANVPPGKEVTPEFLERLRQTAGKVLRIRDGFRDFFDESLQLRIPKEMDGQPESLRQKYKDMASRAMECKLGTLRFADTCVFYAPLVNSHGDLSVLAVYHVLAASAMIMMVSLGTLGVAMRGAVCMGRGMDLSNGDSCGPALAGASRSNGDFYGPALAEAARMESKAGHPRIIVSAETADFVHATSGFTSESLVNGFMRDVATICRSLLCYDVDGNVMVDFLGQGAKKVWGNDGREIVEVIRGAYDFVKHEGRRFQKAGDDKLAGRYVLLQKYIETRLPVWGLGQHVPPDFLKPWLGQ